jgi:hypothetical protein
MSDTFTREESVELGSSWQSVPIVAAIEHWGVWYTLTVADAVALAEQPGDVLRIEADQGRVRVLLNGRCVQVRRRRYPTRPRRPRYR